MEFVSRDWVIIAQVVQDGVTQPVSDRVVAPTPAAAIEKFVGRYQRPVDFTEEVRSVCVFENEDQVRRGHKYAARWLRKNWFNKTPDVRGRNHTKVIDEICGGYICRAKKGNE